MPDAGRSRCRIWYTLGGMSSHREDHGPDHNGIRSYDALQGGSHHRNGFISFVIFLVIVAILGGVCWGGWLLYNRKGEVFEHTISIPTKAISIASTSAPQSLDLRKDSGKSTEQALLNNVYETLVSQDSSGTPAAGIAKSWVVSPDGRSYTFYLNSGMHFSNGDALDAADVVWSLKQIITNKFVDANALANVAEVSNSNASTVTIRLTSPDPLLLRHLYGRAGIVYDKDANINYATQALGSGPYTVSSWKPGTKLQLTLNTKYWGAQPTAVTQATFTYFSDAADMVDALQSKSVDIATPLAPASMAKASNDAKASKISLVTGKSSDTLALVFNARTDSVLSDQRFREAIRYMLDHAAIVATQNGTATAIGGPLSPLDEGYEDLTGLHPHNTAKGAQMAYYFPPSYYNGSLRFIYPQSYGSAIGELVKTQLAAGGVPVTVTMVSDADWKKTVESQHAFDMTLAPMTGAADAATFADPTSLSGYDSPDAQSEWKSVKASRNDAEYRKSIAAYASTVSTQSPVDWLYVSTPVTAYNHTVTNVPSNSTAEYFPLRGIGSAR
ncbi:ABC transporter substrate-binding protein [Bifidobacterium aquikefiri]|uniref:ABC transporter substrate-binding protein n=1 Tax=Bifidobacterium aquikefiri TaxID=1653207 RepID=UPI0039E857EE